MKQTTYDQKMRIDDELARGLLHPLPLDVMRLRIYRFEPVGASFWDTDGDPDKRFEVWVWRSNCRWCGKPFLVTTGAWSIWADALRAVNCMEHRRRPRPEAMVKTGPMAKENTKARNRAMGFRELRDRRINDDANIAIVLEAALDHLRSGGNLSFGGNSKDYVGKRLRGAVKGIGSAGIAQMVRGLVARKLLAHGQIGNYASGNKRLGLIIPKESNL